MAELESFEEAKGDTFGDLLSKTVFKVVRNSKSVF